MQMKLKFIFLRKNKKNQATSSQKSCKPSSKSNVSSFPGRTCFNRRSPLFSRGILRRAGWNGHVIYSGMPRKSHWRETLFLRRTHSYRAHCWRCTICDQAGLRMISVRPLLRFLPISPLIPGPCRLHTELSHNPAHSDYYLPAVLPAFSSTLCFCPLLYSFPLLHRRVLAHLRREAASRNAVVFGTQSLHDIIAWDNFFFHNCFENLLKIT